jgi:hypothetical protein
MKEATARKLLFDAIRPIVLDGHLSQRQVNQIDAVLDKWDELSHREILFFNVIRDMTAEGKLTQENVDTLNKALEQWQGPMKPGFVVKPGEVPYPQEAVEEKVLTGETSSTAG